MLTLAQIAELLGANLPDAAGETAITQLAYDSRQVKSGALFAALAGQKNRGADFVDAAIRNGAAAVFGEDALTLRVPYLRVPDARLALARLAAAFYDFPSRRLKLLGVTGTNGKTTTAFLLRYLLNTSGARAGMLGTIEYDLVAEKIPAPLTTPESLDFTAYLRAIADCGAAFAVAEISSHALDLQRVAGNDFAAAIFTNLTRDHLDYHGTFANYAAAKQKLFVSLAECALAIVNADDAHEKKISANSRARRVRYGIAIPDADYRAENLRPQIDGTIFSLLVRGEKIADNFFMPVPGKHNVYNALAALATVGELGFSLTKIGEILRGFTGVPGRLEKVARANKNVFVDYAHTPDALEKALATLRELRKSGAELWAVFGCGGDRDAGKRPQMARVAERFADRVIVTSDNPRTENPAAIIDQIRDGFQNPAAHFYEPDRRAAIEFALRNAAADAIILIAGKGHENYQIIGAQKNYFSDRETVEQYAR